MAQGDINVLPYSEDGSKKSKSGAVSWSHKAPRFICSNEIE